MYAADHVVKWLVHAVLVDALSCLIFKTSSMVFLLLCNFGKTAQILTLSMHIF